MMESKHDWGMLEVPKLIPVWPGLPHLLPAYRMGWAAYEGYLNAFTLDLLDAETEGISDQEWREVTGRSPVADPADHAPADLGPPGGGRWLAWCQGWCEHMAAQMAMHSTYHAGARDPDHIYEQACNAVTALRLGQYH